MRGFATRKLGAVATLRLKPEDQAHHRDQMNILRDQIRKTKIRNGFISNSDERERRESRWLVVTADGSRPKTVDVRSDLQASSCGTWPLAVSTSGSID